MIRNSSKLFATAFGGFTAAACAMGVAVGGCSSSTSGSSSTGGDGGKGSSNSSGSNASGSSGSGATTGTAPASGSCANPLFALEFSPMYSAVIPGDTTTATFSLPAIAVGVTTTQIAWTPSSDAVTLAADPSIPGGVLITVNPMSSKFAGTQPGAITTVDIIASVTSGTSSACGVSTLNITTTTAAIWQAGQARYNDMVPLGGMGMGGPPTTPDGGFRYACTDCHTPKTNTDGGFTPFSDVAHTPEQTGGFSDQVLLGIIQDGNVPGYSADGGVPSADAGYFDPNIIPYDRWHNLHQWGLTTEEQSGIVAYLRSLTPTAQDGTSNFGGHFGGGPRPDGGYFHHDGGFHFGGSSSAASSGGASSGP